MYSHIFIPPQRNAINFKSALNIPFYFESNICRLYVKHCVLFISRSQVLEFLHYSTMYFMRMSKRILKKIHIKMLTYFSKKFHLYSKYINSLVKMLHIIYFFISLEEEK